MKRDDRRPEFFPFFPAHWIASHAVQAMTPEERGCFIHLLAQSWLDGDCSIPACHSRIAGMCGIGRGWGRVSEAILREFPPHPTIQDRRANPRLLKERAIAEEQMRTRSEQRRIAANKRWGNDAGAMQPHAARNPVRNAPSRGTEQNGTEQNRKEGAARTPARTREAPPARPPVVVGFDVFEEVNDLVEPLEASLPARHPGRGSTQRRAAVAQLVQDFGRDRVAKALAALPDLSVRSPEAKELLRKITSFEDSLDGRSGTDRVEQIERLLGKFPAPNSESELGFNPDDYDLNKGMIEFPEEWQGDLEADDL